MSFIPPPIDQDELMALIDGVLDPQRALQIEQRAQQDAELGFSHPSRQHCHVVPRENYAADVVFLCRSGSTLTFFDA